MKARTFTNTNNNSNTRTKSHKERKEAVINSFEVWGVKTVRNGGNIFNLNVNEMTIYGCSVRATREGEAFVAMPSRKGKDDNWYPVVSCRLPEAISDAIITDVYDKLDEIHEVGEYE